MVPRRRRRLPPLGRAGVRPSAVRHGHVPDERQGAVPPDQVGPGRAMPRRRRRTTQRAVDVGPGLQSVAKVSAEQSGDAHEAIGVPSQSSLASSDADVGRQSVRGEPGVPHVGELGDAVTRAVGRQPGRFARTHGGQSDAGLQERLGRGQSPRQQQPTGHTHRLGGTETQRGLCQGPAESHVATANDAADAWSFQAHRQLREGVFPQRFARTQHE